MDVRHNPSQGDHDPVFADIECSTHLHRVDGWVRGTRYRLFSLTVPTNAVWPTSTTIACWNCCHPFSGTPLSVPRPPGHCIAPNNRNLYHVMGVFCSVNCAKRFMLDTGGQNVNEALMQFVDICVTVWGLRLEDVVHAAAAPPRWLLTLFGGELDVEAFRAKSLVCRTRVVEAPFLTHAMVTEDAPQHQLYGLRRPELVATAPKEIVGPPSLFQCLLQKGEKRVVAPEKVHRPRKKPAVATGLSKFLQ